MHDANIPRTAAHAYEALTPDVVMDALADVGFFVALPC
jgi:hypothetical protein